MIVACKISPKGDRDEMHSLQLDVKNEIYENNKTKGNVDSEKFTTMLYVSSQSIMDL